MHLEQQQSTVAYASPHGSAGSRHWNRPIHQEGTASPPRDCIQQTGTVCHCPPVNNLCCCTGASALRSICSRSGAARGGASKSDGSGLLGAARGSCAQMGLHGKKRCSKPECRCMICWERRKEQRTGPAGSARAVGGRIAPLSGSTGGSPVEVDDKAAA